MTETTTTTTNNNVNISQEYFDEVCLENRDDFELSEDEAVQETIQQLTSYLGRGLPSHLVLTFPTSEKGIAQRKVNQVLKTCIANLQQQQQQVSETLQTLVDCVQEDSRQLVPRFVSFRGFATCVNLWKSCVEGRDERVYGLLQTTFTETAQVAKVTRTTSTDSDNNTSVLQFHDLQNEFLRLWPTWLATLEDEISSVDNVEEWNVGRVCQILDLANCAVKNSEPNKKAFMASKSTNTSMKSSPSLLLSILDKLSLPNEKRTLLDHHRLIGNPLCRLIAALCTFDDFRVTQGAPTIASAHANVQSFHRENGVVRIARYLQETKTSSAILALRAMAIHDEIVQTMVAVGVLDTSTSLLHRLVSTEKNSTGESIEESLEALTAVVGLFRNVSANDEIKSKLCVGDKSIVANLKCAMEAHSAAAKLQEHACATFAAMALRSPRNAEYLVRQHDAATWVVRAMQNHPSRTTVQRQAALALRNLVSRSTDLRPVVLQAGAAEALTGIAAKHVSCQDEVYAALRDLGLPASMLRVEQDASGQLVLKQTEMFGEHKSNFRPVFDEF